MEINALVDNFWWGQQGSERKIHWKNWKSLTLPKSEGGLGIRKSREANFTLLEKLGWAVETNRSSLVCSILRSKYLSHGPLNSVTRTSGASSTWRSILKCRPLISKVRKWLIGNGTSVQLWRDWWVGDGPLMEALE